MVDDRVNPKMSPSQEAHLEYIKKSFEMLVDVKYRKGQREHGGNLINNSIEFFIDAAIDEAIDQVVYLISLREKLEPFIPVHK